MKTYNCGSNCDCKAPHTIGERGFWRCPTQVFTGLAFLAVGSGIGYCFARLI